MRTQKSWEVKFGSDGVCSSTSGGRTRARILAVRSSIARTRRYLSRLASDPLMMMMMMLNLPTNMTHHDLFEGTTQALMYNTKIYKQ